MTYTIPIPIKSNPDSAPEVDPRSLFITFQFQIYSVNCALPTSVGAQALYRIVPETIRHLLEETAGHVVEELRIYFSKNIMLFAMLEHNCFR